MFILLKKIHIFSKKMLKTKKGHCERVTSTKSCVRGIAKGIS